MQYLSWHSLFFILEYKTGKKTIRAMHFALLLKIGNFLVVFWTYEKIWKNNYCKFDIYSTGRNKYFLLEKTYMNFNFDLPDKM